MDRVDVKIGDSIELHLRTNHRIKQWYELHTTFSKEIENTRSDTIVLSNLGEFKRLYPKITKALLTKNVLRITFDSNNGGWGNYDVPINTNVSNE